MGLANVDLHFCNYCFFIYDLGYGRNKILSIFELPSFKGYRLQLKKRLPFW
jgi:hypothetical protein